MQTSSADEGASRADERTSLVGRQASRLWSVIGTSSASRTRAVLLAIFAVIAVLAFSVAVTRTSSRTAASSPAPGSAALAGVHGSRGAVAADDQRCSELGVRVLRDLRGNAADATVTTLLCQGAVAPFGSGIGGGAFILVRPPQGGARVYDARETAPSRFDPDLYDRHPEWTQHGGASVAVPAELRGLQALHSDFGRANWTDLVNLVVPYAEESIVNRVFVHKMKLRQSEIHHSKHLSNLLMRNSSVSKELLREGDVYRNKELANTLRAIARRGPDALYVDLVQEISRVVQDAGGFLTANDIRKYRVRCNDALRSDYRGYTIFGAPLPSAGGASIAMALNILEGAALSRRGRDSSSYVYLVEALKHVFAWRPLLGDPRFTDGALHAVRQMLDKSLARRLQSRIDIAHTFPPNYYSRDLRFSTEDHGTTHVSIADGDGMAVSATSTINLPFGSGVVAAGILLNNEMDDFSLSHQPNYFGIPPSLANRIKAGKRPLSSMSPTIVVRDGRPVLVAGGSGGPRIITSTLQTIINVIDWGDTVQDAVAAPRLHHQLIPNVAYMESVNNKSCARTSFFGDKNPQPSTDYWSTVCNALKSAGHVLRGPYRVGTVQAVLLRDEIDGDRGVKRRMYAASDPRKFGKAAAY